MLEVFDEKALGERDPMALLGPVTIKVYISITYYRDIHFNKKDFLILGILHLNKNHIISTIF